MLNVYDSEIFGAHDLLYLPAFDFTTISFSAELKFDIAYAPYSSSLAEELSIRVSTDCGSNWTEVFSKDGAALATAPSTTTSFIPTASQWRTETIQLGVFMGEPEVLIQFDVMERRGNNLYLDNIMLIDQATKVNEVAENTLHIYPQPASEKINIESVEMINQIKVISHEGKQLMDRLIKSNSATLDISMFDTGIYYLLVSSVNQTSPYRIIISN
jgi:hypothetical protein